MISEPLPLWRVAAPVFAFLFLALICRIWPLPLLRIVLLCSCALIFYACLQDQISARLCREYFTVGHPTLPAPLTPFLTPTVIGLIWGFLGGFPGGILLGIPVALAANLGKWPRISAQQLKKPLLYVLLSAGLATFIAGGSGWYNARVAAISLGEPWKTALAPETHLPFFVVACAHFGTYLGVATAGLFLCGWIVGQRRQFKSQHQNSATS